MSDLPKLGFIGIGLMGKPMTLRLLAAGYTVAVWNRSKDKLVPVTAPLKVPVVAVRAPMPRAPMPVSPALLMGVNPRAVVTSAEARSAPAVTRPLAS